MDIHQFTQLLKSHEREVKQYVSRKLPVKAGAKTKSFVQENFRKGGFQEQYWRLLQSIVHIRDITKYSIVFFAWLIVLQLG